MVISFRIFIVSYVILYLSTDICRRSLTSALSPFCIFKSSPLAILTYPHENTFLTYIRFNIRLSRKFDENMFTSPV